ncbi:MAG TPA: Coq4 family protein [Aquabacterium sp.]|mgnify:CR=1 FL=1|nr:Coq4 family protein [Aquabacterium sp.]HRH29439.1 Coq4 family protein [Aquabacterium sp.]
MSLDLQPPTPIRPLMALRALLALRDNPQDTRQVFLLGEAIKGKSPQALRERFRQSPQGRERLAERRSLLDALTRTEWLAQLPPGTVGRVYHDFLAEQGLSAQGLVEISKAGFGAIPDDGSDQHYIAQRLRDMHDLFHVLAGYGRDEVGEACVLAFSYPHQGTRSFAVIASLGALVLARRFGHPGVIGAVIEAYRRGKRAHWLPGLPLETLLARPLAEVRRELNIESPSKYLDLLQALRSRGLEVPYPPGRGTA